MKPWIYLLGIHLHQADFVIDQQPVEMNEVAEKMSCNFPLHGLAFVATDATPPLVNSNSNIPLKFDV
ncbi:hypothetical protein Tco_0126610 [Tanacetum coccineum]